MRDLVLELLYASASSLLLLPVQDVFGWRDRVNVPALVDDKNWTWKMPLRVDDEGDADARERHDALARWAKDDRRAQGLGTRRWALGDPSPQRLAPNPRA